MPELYDRGTLSSNGQTSAWDHEGGTAFMVGEGTFGGGTLTLEFSPDDGITWVATGQTLTSDGIVSLALPRCQIRGSLAGATAPTLNVYGE